MPATAANHHRPVRPSQTLPLHLPSCHISDTGQQTHTHTHTHAQVRALEGFLSLVKAIKLVWLQELTGSADSPLALYRQQLP